MNMPRKSKYEKSLSDEEVLHLKVYIEIMTRLTPFVYDLTTAILKVFKEAHEEQHEKN